ncbi:HNH endonuclease signature motif containing protein [Erwinia sp. MMLR14_017]|uniref:HNH endonuclease signature motif containing protein n=1 Tax=Erwinia sp. MMLR14_017 TaxID=3093842 RepID=UPI00298FFBDF|nr:HNH endonuclease signature motif containing protein [Erwinia sp. MMLR14_017]MDW8847255.1 HNH endonuclease signature motif containing protein [Erwinia sp. MMLR14_017]
MANTGQKITAIRSAIDASTPNSKTFDEYQLVEIIDKNYIDLLKIRGFEKLVGKWHKEKLPFLEITGELEFFKCPYCDRAVSAESLRIDHIIPWEVYTRYKIYLAANKKAGERASKLKRKIIRKEAEKQPMQARKGKSTKKNQNNINKSIFEEDLSDSQYFSEPEDELENMCENILQMKPGEEDFCWLEAYYAAFLSIPGNKKGKTRSGGVNEKDSGENKSINPEYTAYFKINNKIFQPKDLSELKKKAANNNGNLVLCCNSCNQEKKGDFEDVREFIIRGGNYSKGNNKLCKKFEDIESVRKKIDVLHHSVREIVVKKEKYAPYPSGDEVNEEILKYKKQKNNSGMENTFIGNNKEKLSAMGFGHMLRDHSSEVKNKEEQYQRFINLFIHSYMNAAAEKFEDEGRVALDYSGRYWLSQSRASGGRDNTRDTQCNNGACQDAEDNVQKEAADTTAALRSLTQSDSILDSAMTDKEEEGLKAHLLKELTLEKSDSFKGYVCFYCLGVYEEFCFEIDHIRPEMKYKGKKYKYQGDDHFHYLAMTNFPSNLIPVCKKCNGSKSDKNYKFFYHNDFTELVKNRQKTRHRYGFTDKLDSSEGNLITYQQATVKRMNLLNITSLRQFDFALHGKYIKDHKINNPGQVTDDKGIISGEEDS